MLSYYQIAGHTFRLSFLNKPIEEHSLSNYAPFAVKEQKEHCLFHLVVTDKLRDEIHYTPVGQFEDDIASIGISKSEEGNFRFRIARPGGEDYGTMDADACFREARAQLPEDERQRFFCLNNCLMLLYAFAASKLDTLLIHASVIRNNNEGFVFLGKSGTGKSTHSRLWLDHIEGSEPLNDDNPVIRIIDDKATIFGTPWSGKTACYKNESVPLKGIVKLRQAPENKIRKLLLIQAYAAILPACSCMRWEENMMAGVHRTVEKLATSVDCYQLGCLPDQAAAELSYNTIR